MTVATMHKNASRAPLRPLDAPTLALTTFGLGFLRPAPGSWGSLPPVVMAWVLMSAGVTHGVLMWALIAVLVTSSVVCIAFGRYAERRFGRKDAAEVVADETAAQCLPLLALPAAWGGSVWAGLPGWLEAGVLCGACFVLFRAADVWKPWPARQLESLPHGWGVLIDDLIAALYAALVMRILLFVPVLVS